MNQYTNSILLTMLLFRKLFSYMERWLIACKIFIVNGLSVLGKMPSPPRRNATPENCPPENCPPPLLPWNFFVNFFLSLVFIFMIIFVHRKNLFSFNYFFYYEFVYFICLRYIFDFQTWHMFIIHICMTSNAGLRYLATRFFDKQRFFSTQPQCCLTFSETVA